jgi:UDP-N-acetylmuramyl pentapeptide phosphotransferase/UDP-N-acetylglucosamine-1-phosphate transferase
LFNPGDVWLALLALPVSAFTVWLLSRGLAARIALDHPNPRSLHTTPIPRTGGIGVVAGVAVGWAAVGGTLPVALWGGAALLAVLSFVDDRYGLSTSVRFIAHIVVAVWLLAVLGTGWNLWLWPVAVAAIVWMTNLYNFMDGSDGLAGGMALFGFGFFAIAAATHGQPDLALATLTVAAAALGFLVFNLPPARVFMGDAGSISLGFLAGGFGVLGAVRDVWPTLFPVLVFLPFIVDASVTLLRRGLRGEKVWHAHKEHYYQRLILMGWSHRQTALVGYALMAGSGSIALITLFMAEFVGFLIATLWCAQLIALMWFVDGRWRDFQENQAIELPLKQ